ncbi:hypothetical protein [Mycobacterium sp. NPDC050853]|uniref:hypothetical protein n=1 Tax=Mycobacteriaceae TaxID=1762 RepID=UPI0015DFADB1|nr:hypothetical protein [Mycobacteroides sp. LB1]
MSSREVRIDPESVHLGAWNASNATSDAAADLAKHARDIRAHAEGWVGSSLSALEDLMERWETRHFEHEERMGNVGQILNDASKQFLNLDLEGLQPPGETREV